MGNQGVNIMNKNGWGLRVELAFILLFVICIIVSTIGLYRMGLIGTGENAYIDLGEYTRGGNYDYASLEATVAQAGSRYYSDRYPAGLNDTVIVSVKTLKNNGYMTPIYDSRNKECKGYAKLLSNGNSIAYIKCSVYKTVGYSENYE